MDARRSLLMLVLTIYPDEVITITTRTGEIVRLLAPLDGHRCRIAIDAPRDFRIEREKKFLTKSQDVVQ